MEETKEDQRCIQIYLKPTLRQMECIDRDMTLMRKLRDYLVISCNNKVEQLKENTSYGDICSAMGEIIQRMKELEGIEKECKKTGEKLDAELAEELKELRDKMKDLVKKKYEFFRSEPSSMVRFELDSMRRIVHLEQDMLTPAPDEQDVLLHYGIDGRPYYESGKSYYTLLPGSERMRKDGTFTAIMCECMVISKTADEDGTLTDKVFSDCVIMKSGRNRPRKDGKEERGNEVTVLVHKELLRLDSKGNDIVNFCSRFVSERVHSRKHKKGEKSQKTSMTYSDYGFVANDFKYGLGKCLTASFGDFPATRNHAVNNEVRVISVSPMSKKMKIIKKDGRHYVRYRVSRFNPNLKYSDTYVVDGKFVCTDILIDVCSRNKGRIGTEYDYDTLVLDFVMDSKRPLDIIRTSIRDKKKYLLKIPMPASIIQMKKYTENSLNQILGTGIVGIDPNMHMFTAYGKDCGTARVFSFESIVDGKIGREIAEIDRRIDEIDRFCGNSKRECNPQAINENKRFKKGCRLQYSKKYMTLRKERRELFRRRAVLKEWLARYAAHEILGMGDTFYSELPMSGKAKEKKEPQKNENGKFIRTNPFAKSIQNFSVGGLIERIRDLVVSRGGKWFLIDDRSGCTKHSPDGKSVQHGMSERTVMMCGRPFQRDVKSAMCMTYASELEPVYVKNKKGESEQKMKDKCPVCRIVKFDDEKMLEDMDKLYESNLAEMNRLKSLDVRDETVDVENFFEILGEN